MTPEELEAIKRSGDKYALGCRESGVRPSDYVAAKLPRATLPSLIKPAVGKVPVKSQQGGTCVGNSFTLTQTYNEWEETGDVVSFDGEALNMHVVGHDFGQGAAASPHDVLDYMLKHGLQGPTGLYFPKGYAWVDWQDIENIKAAMSLPRTMVSVSLWLQENFGVDNGKTFAPYVPGDAWGYHQVTLVGYGPEGVLLQNSWDTWWGDGGFARLSWENLQKRAGECWAVTDNSDTVKEGFVKTFDYGPVVNRAIKRLDLPTRKRPAVYRVLNDAREWIPDPFAAKRMGVNLYAVEKVPDTDKVWELPVVGQDAPRDQR